MANEVWRRIDHKIWQVDQEVNAGSEDPPTFTVSDEFLTALLSRLTPDEHRTLLWSALAESVTSQLHDVRDDGCTCDEHRAEYRAEVAAALAGGEGK